MNSHQPHRSRKLSQRLPVIMLITLLMIVLGFVFASTETAVAETAVLLSPANLEADCPNFPVTVATEAALNSTIACFNSLTTAGNYTLTLTADINLTASTTVINNSTAGVELHIEGDGHTVDGQDQSGVLPFQVAANTIVTMRQITVTNGMNSGNGGAIANDGNLTIQYSTISSSEAGGVGGGIANKGTLTVSNSTVSDNQGVTWGGGIDNRGTLTVINSTISGNRLKSTGFSGHAIYNESSATIINSTIADNEGQVGDAVYNNTAGNLVLQNAILANNTSNDCVSYGGTVTAAYTLIEDTGPPACDLTHGVNGNIIGQTPNLGPLQDNGGSTLTHALLPGSPAINAGSNALAVDGSGVALAYEQRGEGFPRVFGAAVDMGAFEQSCMSPWSAGVIPSSVGSETALNAAISCFNEIDVAGSYTISLTNNISLTAATVAINNDNSITGAELTIEGDGHTLDGMDQTDVRPFEVAANTIVTLSQITLTGGNVEAYGGGLRNAGFTTIQNSTIANNNGNLIGGGIYNNGTMAINSSTISGNQADYGGGVDNESNMTVTNSTISGNQAQIWGGGINNFGTLTVTNNTLSDNGAPNGGGIYTGEPLILINSIIANSNSGGDCKITGSGTVSAVYSLIEDTGASACNLSNGTNNNIIGQDPNLGALQDNGGPTHTLALQPGSPAIDAADDSICASAPVNGLDQRGVVRPFGPHCDMGAYEWAITQPGPDFVVNTDADTDDGACDLLGQGVGNKDCTLREAINAANAAADVSVITFAGDYAIALTGSLPALTTAMTIDGDTTTTSVDGADAYQLFTIPAAVNVTVQNLDLANGLGLPGPAGGGALYNNGGTVTLANCTVASNKAEKGGSIYNRAGTLAVTACTVEGNQTTFSGGGGISNEATLTVSDSLFLNNTTDSGGIIGAAIFNGSGAMLTVDNSTFQNNTASGSGGAVASSGPATITNSRFIDNTSTSFTFGGGAIFIYGTSSMDIANSTFSGNQATKDGGSININQSASTLTVTNSTFYDNTAGVNGGGIWNTGNTTVVNSTFSANAGAGGGGLYNNANQTTLFNSIVAGSTSGGDCLANSGAITADGFNLDTDGSCDNATQKTAVEIDLQPLADNGGPTETMALTANSAALDAGDDAVCAAAVGSPTYGAGGLDQRGVVRPYGPHCDIGAFEFDSATQPGPDFVVNTNADTDDGVCDLPGQGVGNQDCTLREAINAANDNADASAITLAGDYTITLSSVLPDISTNITIDGAGQVITVDGANAYRIFYVTGAGNLSINALTMQNGYSLSTAGIDNQFGIISVSNSLFRDNNGGSTAGALHNYFGSVTISNSTFYSNTGGFSGGVANIGGSASINNATFSGNSSGTATIYTIAGGCFTEKAQILMADGYTKSVAEIQVGDQVLSYDFVLGEQVVREVTDVINYSVDTFLRINDLEVTREHPFAIGEDEWIMAGELKIGDRILGTDGWTTVTSINTVERPSEVYNFTVDDTHNYYVSDGTHTYLAHNKVLAANAGEVTLTNSIITDSVGPDCVSIDLGIFTGGNNLLDDYASGDCAAISDVAVTGLAGTPEDHGGSTNTIALFASSNALGAGDGLSCTNSDQRGVVRPQGVACDVGAYEFWGLAITAVTTTDASLDWNSANAGCTYDIFESTMPYFTPTEPADYTTASLTQVLAGKLGTVGTNYFYINRATCDSTITAYSNEVGEFDFALVPGN